MSDSARLKRAGIVLAMAFRTQYLTLICLVGALGLLSAPTFAAAAGDLTPTPTQLDFATQDIHNGGTNFQTVKLSNSTGVGVAASSIETTGPNAVDFSDNSNCDFIADGESCAINVSFDPTTPGAKSAKLEIVEDNGTINVPLTGTGATGTLSDSSPNFGPSQPYYFGGQEQSANISNNSLFSAQATTATITGSDAAFFSVGYNGCQFTINPGNNCSVGVVFNPTGPGTKTAQLELSNDGTTNPLIIPLSATALSGPDAVISPSLNDFGDVAAGSTSPAKTVSITNAGDYPLQIQQLLVISGAPQLFPISEDLCSSKVIAPGASCQFTVRFQPSAAGIQGGTREGTVFVITNQNGPVATANLIGTGVTLPQGSASITGTNAAGSLLNCAPSGYPGGTLFTYQWLRNGQTIPAATDAQFTPSEADVGMTLSCRVQATNSVGSETVTSPQSGPIAPLDLSNLQASLVERSVCRVMQAPAQLRLAGTTIRLDYGKPITPYAPLRLNIPRVGAQVLIDGQSIASSRGHVVLTPRALLAYADGAHTLQVNYKSDRANEQIALAPCDLAARLDGSSRQATDITVSASVGMSSPLLRLPPTLRLHVVRATLGSVSIQPADQPVQTFNLYGARTSFNGITVLLKAHTIEVRNLPAETGVVSIMLNRGVVTGRGGSVNATVTLRGDTAPSRADAHAVWGR
ncbi:MAG TPA: choice-of-anchor D domain-containing protein [Solirubrobacteraceae bacterium]|nr:choice-of-anchor D domain-containing protein [Solirubrobacteraceae bacterium]